MKENKFVKYMSKTLKSIKFRAIVLCICLSFVLWSFITFSDYRQHEFRIPIQFENSIKPDDIYNTKDSVVMVRINATGFYFLFKNGFKAQRESFRFDISNLSINMAKGETKLPSDLFKASIAKALNMEDAKMSIIPDTIHLTWQKKFLKTVPVVNKTKFECKPSYRMQKEPEFFYKEIRIEGEQRILEKIDTLYTKEFSLSNIDKDNISLIPLEINQQHQSLYFQTTNIPVRIDVEEVTENIIEIPVRIEKKGLNEDVKIYPSSVSVKYRLPIKDYKNVKSNNFYFYVVCDQDIHNHKKLTVKYTNIPHNVEILEINPKRLNYIILNQ